jgi:hypothetical protein
MSLELSERIGLEKRVQFGALRKNRFEKESSVWRSPKESAQKREGSSIECLDCRWGKRENIWSEARACATCTT